jgi:hypothetical protein
MSWRPMESLPAEEGQAEVVIQIHFELFADDDADTV